MIFDKKNPIGIVSYGAYIPKQKILGEEIAKSQGKLEQKIYKSLGVESKTVPNVDEDTITISTMAGFQALERLEVLEFGKEQEKEKEGASVNVAKDKNSGFVVKNSVRKDVGALFIGSESHPYAVKPSGTVVAQALGIASDSFEGEGEEVDCKAKCECEYVGNSASVGSNLNCANFGEESECKCAGENHNIVKNTKPLALADLQFACKAGTQSMQIAGLYVSSGFSKYALAIGADTAQSRPGDVLEYTAGAGGGAIILGRENRLSKVDIMDTMDKSNDLYNLKISTIKAEVKNKLQNKNKNDKKNEIEKIGGNGDFDGKLLAKLIATTSVATDTPDFWRRPNQQYPEHAGRFTAGPGYFNHISMAVKMVMDETGLTTKDFEYCVFHTPNAKFPKNIAKKLGFNSEQIKASLVVKQIGNTYAGASMLGLINTLDIAKKNKKILMVSYGSGSGSDAFIFETTEYLEEARKIWKREGRSTQQKIVSEFLEDQINKLESI